MTWFPFSVQHETIDATIAGIGSKAMYAGGGTGVVGFLLSSGFIGLGGLLIALIGLVVNIRFKRRANKRLEREHDAHMVEHRLRVEELEARIASYQRGSDE